MSKNYDIVFNRPAFVGNELEYIAQALESAHLSGDGQFTSKCSDLLQDVLQLSKVLLTTSCTHALEMSALLLNIEQGDEVILPSFTFVSTANAFVLRGAKPVFVDIRPDTFNIDEKLIEARITSKTKAIVPVHYGGIGCKMEDICSVASKHGISVVEDNAHGLFAKYKEKHLGTFGSMSTLSFHETKNFQCGEGGALLINDDSLIERAEIIREKGTNRKRFFRGQVDKYTWVDIGSSYLLSDLLAAFLFAQLEARDTIKNNRKSKWLKYENGLKEWAQRESIGMPFLPQDSESSYHIFYLLFADLDERNSFINHLGERGILAIHHYVPLHTSEMGHKYGYKQGDLPITESISDRLVRLPLYNGLTDEDLARVIESTVSFRAKSQSLRKIAGKTGRCP